MLYTALAKNPNWNITTFTGIGMGSKMCVQLFKWLTSILDVAIRQQEFLSLIATSFPDWLPKLHELQKVQRAMEFELEVNGKALEILDNFQERSAGDDTLLDVLNMEYLLVKRSIYDARDRLKDTLKNVGKLKTDQTAREVYALLAMEQKVEENTNLLKELGQKFSTLTKLAAEANDRAAIDVSGYFACFLCKCVLLEYMHARDDMRCNRSSLGSVQIMLSGAFSPFLCCCLAVLCVFLCSNCPRCVTNLPTSNYW
jgi:hypothetical protein